MPVASTTSAAGQPRAKRAYQSRLSGVTKPLSVARQGTMAGTQALDSSCSAWWESGENSIDRAASTVEGQVPGSALKRIR